MRVQCGSTKHIWSMSVLDDVAQIIFVVMMLHTLFFVVRVSVCVNVYE